MEVRELEHKGNKYAFLVKGTDHIFVNTLRRLIIDEVPTMAIEDIEFKANDSVLYDEVLAHRLGLVPIKTDLKTYKFPDPSLKGEASATTHVSFTLKTKAEGTVDASKMKSNDPKVIPVHENTPITYLGEGQRLEFTATAHLGRGCRPSKPTYH